MISLQQTELTLAEALTLAIRDAGVSHVFGVSGANIESFHDALFRLARHDITSLLCKSERGASFMADGFARQSGTLAVCCSTSGGGMMNLAVGLAESRNSGIPVLAIIGCPPSGLAGRGAFQDGSGGRDRIDAELLWQAVAKYSTTVTPAKFWLQLQQAIKATREGFKGPAVLLIPSDFFTAPVTTRPAFFAAETSTGGGTVPAHQLYQLELALRRSRHPLLIAGPAVSGNRELQHFSFTSGIPVATTMESTAAFPHHHPRFMGVLGVAGHRNVHDYLRTCDLVVSLGSQLEIMTRGAAQEALDSIPIHIYHTSTASAPVSNLIRLCECDPNSVILGLRQTLVQFRSAPLSQPERAPTRRRLAATSHEDGMTTTGALQLLQPFVPHFNQFLFDAGNCAAAAAHLLALPDHARSHIALGMGGMGYAIAAAIGMRLSQPEGATLVICGDGAFLMEGLEIHTAIELKLKILYLVFNDSQHGMCVSRQRHFFDDRIFCTTYSTVNFTELTRGLAGENACYCAQVTDARSLHACLDEYLSQDEAMPGVIELMITQEELPAFFPLNSDIVTQRSSRLTQSEDELPLIPEQGLR